MDRFYYQKKGTYFLLLQNGSFLIKKEVPAYKIGTYFIGRFLLLSVHYQHVDHLSVFMCAIIISDLIKAILIELNYNCVYVFYIFEYILHVCQVLTYYTHIQLTQGILKSVFAITNFPMPLPRSEPVAPNRPRLSGKHGMHSPNSLTIKRLVR